MTYNRPWTRDDTAVLRDGVAGRVPFKTIAARLDRSLNAVCVRASKLGLRQPDAPGHPALGRLEELRAQGLSLAACRRVLRLSMYMTRRLEAERVAANDQETA